MFVMKKFVINEKDAGLTLEKFTKKVLNVAPLSFIYKLFRKKDVKVNDHWQDGKYVLNVNDEVKIYVSDEQFDEFVKKEHILNNEAVSKYIIYEDENILILNKPKGLLVQPDKTGVKSLDRMVVEYYADLLNNSDNAFKPGPIHRLDRNTSGIVLFGKNIRALQYFSNVFNDHDLVGKHYYALVVGDVKEDGFIDVPIKKGNNNKVYVSYDKDSKEAKTIYHVLERYGEYTLLDVILLTGRTHQIRVHMAHINHPVVGDEKYGNFNVNKLFNEKYNLKSQFLHAYELNFLDLESPFQYLKNKTFIAKMPNELINILKDLKGI